VPVDETRTVTLVRQYRASIDRMVLETPAGTCDVAGEAAETTARRELAEEAGLQAASMERLMGTFNTPGISDQFTTIFLATGLSPVPARPAGVEEGFMTIETIELRQVDDLVADGTLVDETTVLGLLLARDRLAR
jgi:ADP-ribose pyrophosphatase